MKRTKELKNNVIRRKIKTLFKAACLSGLLVSLGLCIYCYFLSHTITKRFASRMWQIPSIVYADPFFLFPGKRINRANLLARLERLGYLKTQTTPDTKGIYRVTPDTIDIFLKDLVLPTRKRQGFRALLTFSKDRLHSMIRFEDHLPISLLELNPEEIMRFFGPAREQRHLVSIKNIPNHFKYAIIAAEDTRFYHHLGIDPKGMVRAALKNITHGRIKQGASTITQQLAKNYFLTPQRTYTRKAREILIALTLEMLYTKDEILEIYLNEIYLGQKGSVSINGVGEAAQFYFGKSPKNLTSSEAAVIAGLIKAPNLYSPYKHPQRAQKRRDQVLRIMREKAWLTEKAFQKAVKAPIHTRGYVHYQRRAPYFIDYLSAQLKALYPKEALMGLGLSIYTTLDTEIQAQAEKALHKGLARIEKHQKKPHPKEALEGGVIVIQPKTGHILSMVGGRSYTKSQFNRITQARRQPGSLFKPFVYLCGLERYPPCAKLSNAEKTYFIDGNPWTPKNFVHFPEKEVTVREAIARSMNLPTVDLAMHLGLDAIIDMTRKFQMTTPLKPYPSLALGAFEVIPIELAAAYCTFAAEGVMPYLLSMKKVVAEDGKPLSKRHMRIKTVISPEAAYIMTSLLQSVVAEGTARSLKNVPFNVPIAAKTGTSNNERDAWFIGYTPDILALVWVGYDSGASIGAGGATAALPIWRNLMTQLPQYQTAHRFKIPENIVTHSVCVQSGLLARKFGCPKTREELFLPGAKLPPKCNIHGGGTFFNKILNKMTELFDHEE